MNKKLENIVHELDHGTGSILCNKESLEAMKIELGHIREDADNTDQSNLELMGLRFRDFYHKIVMLDDLLHFVMKEFDENLSHVENIKTKLFEEVVSNKKEEK